MVEYNYNGQQAVYESLKIKYEDQNEDFDAAPLEDNWYNENDSNETSDVKEEVSKINIEHVDESSEGMKT